MAKRLIDINLGLETSPRMSKEIEENYNKEVKRFKDILEDLKEYEVIKAGSYLFDFIKFLKFNFRL